MLVTVGKCGNGFGLSSQSKTAQDGHDNFAEVIKILWANRHIVIMVRECMPGRNSKLGFTVVTEFCTIKLRANGINFWGGRVVHERTKGLAPEVDAIAIVEFVFQGVKDRPDLFVTSLHVFILLSKNYLRPQGDRPFVGDGVKDAF